ncbi:hypothetical protein SDC9_181959 [bioreactor metagenome]|uniref:TRAP C4-dicarboxylate transport system permease DctM subunit domain-containing protein n=1 Tax=bioreactor metagenome TaxID=1076179 RepID=A0A645H7J1_9ZZZZ
MLLASLPAPATNMEVGYAFNNAFSIVKERAYDPKLILITVAPFCAAYIIPLVIVITSP